MVKQYDNMWVSSIFLRGQARHRAKKAGAQGLQIWGEPLVHTV